MSAERDASPDYSREAAIEVQPFQSEGKADAP